MALANFFDKAALAASQVLRNWDHSAFVAILDTQVVGVAFDDAAASSPEGWLSLELSVSLLARLYPRIALVDLTGSNGSFVTELAARARAVNPVIEIKTSLADASVCVALGETAVSTTAPVVYVGSDGWVVRVSPEGPLGSGTSSNPFGAGAAACFGAANVFRILFGSSLPNGVPDGRFSMSLLDFDPTAATPTNPPFPDIVDLGESHLVGLGAIGNGAVWALSKMHGLGGRLNLVDHESVDLSNLQRYVLTTQDDVGAVKVALAAGAFRGTDLDVRQHQARWGDYLSARGNWYLERVAVAVDSGRLRCEIQASLPRWLVNAWTQAGDLGVSRHGFVGDQACLMCLYLPEKAQRNEDQLVADAIGLPDDVMEVRNLLYSGKPVGREVIERIAHALALPVEPLVPYADLPLRAFYSEAVCGGVVLSLGGRSGDVAKMEVPMAFQSALAGIMLAAELVANAAGLKRVLPPVATRIDLLSSIGEYLSQPVAKHKSGTCICQDVDYLAAYRSKYPLVSDGS